MNRLNSKGFSGSAFLVLFVGVFALNACATPSDKLVEARKTYEKIADGKASDYAPAELQSAKEALERAETAFENDGNSKVTEALAYTAIRRAKIAEVEADIYLARQQKQEIERTYIEESQEALKRQTQQLREARTELQETRQTLQEAKKEGTMTQKELREQRELLEKKRQTLAEQEKKLAVTQQELETERERRKEAEERLAKAKSRLEQFAKLEEDKDRMVITLTGEVIFELNESTLRKRAKARLNQVAEVLLADRDRELTVEGHTDSQGKEDYNEKLSQKRAESVRDYLVSQGIAEDRIKAIGKGERDPVAENDTAEGRAMNRRVEIIAEKPDSSK